MKPARRYGIVAPDPPRFRTARWVLLLALILVSGVIVLQAWWTNVEDKEATGKAEQANRLMVVRLLEEHAARQLKQAAQRLDVITERIQNIDQPDKVRDEQVHRVFDDTIRHVGEAAALQFVNIDGQRWASIGDFPSYVFPNEERSYIAALLTDPSQTAIIVGKPLNRFIDNTFVLPLARNVFDRRGNHLGLISTEVSLTYFKDFYERVALANAASVQLLKNSREHIIIAGPNAANVPPMGNATTGVISDQNAARPYSWIFRQVADFPITLYIGRPVDDVFEEWRKRAIERSAAAGVFLLLYGWLIFYLLSHMRALQQATDALRQSEARFATLFQRAPLPMALMRLDDDKLIGANSEIIHLYGYQLEEFLGRTPIELGLWGMPEARPAYLSALRESGFVDAYDVVMRRRDGSCFDAELSSRVIEMAGQALVVFAPINVSRQKEDARLIRELNTDLERRVEQRTATLNDALARLRAVQRELVQSEKMAALGALVAGIAHELNTPIGNALTSASALRDQADLLCHAVAAPRPSRSELVRLADSMRTGSELTQRSIERAGKLVVSFKRVAADRSKEQVSTFDVGDTVAAIVRSLSYSLPPGYALDLDCENDLVVSGYAMTLGEVIEQLIENAIVHGYRHRNSGKVLVRCGRRGDESWYVTVRDQGLGMDQDVLARVCDPFFTTRLGQGASGLGMHITYNLVTAVLGGALHIESAPGAGTTVELVFPVLMAELSAVDHGVAGNGAT